MTLYAASAITRPTSLRDTPSVSSDFTKRSSEFTVTGRFRDWDVFARLGEIKVPALVMGGRYDEIRVDHLTDIQAGIAGSELVIFEHSGHTPFHDERELFMQTVNDFLDRVEHRVS